MKMELTRELCDYEGLLHRIVLLFILPIVKYCKYDSDVSIKIDCCQRYDADQKSARHQDPRGRLRGHVEGDLQTHRGDEVAGLQSGPGLHCAAALHEGF